MSHIHQAQGLGFEKQALCPHAELPGYVRLVATPGTAARQAPLSFTISRSSLRFTSIELVMLSNHLIFCCPLLLLPSSACVPLLIHSGRGCVCDSRKESRSGAREPGSRCCLATHLLCDIEQATWPQPLYLSKEVVEPVKKANFDARPGKQTYYCLSQDKRFQPYLEAARRTQVGPGEPGANSRRTSSKGVMTIRSSPKGSQSTESCWVPSVAWQSSPRVSVRRGG